MQIISRVILLVFPLSVLALSTGSLADSSKKSTTPSEWRSNPVYSKQLASSVKIGDFYVSPPLGYTFEKKQTQNNVRITTEYDWRGVASPNGTKPRFVIAVFKTLPGVVDDRTSEEMITNGLDAMSDSQKHYIHIELEHGKISDLSFVRAYWKRDPNDAAGGKRFHGFQYGYKQGAISVSIIGSDVEPHYKSTLDLLEAAALTFHK